MDCPRCLEDFGATIKPRSEQPPQEWDYTDLYDLSLEAAKTEAERINAALDVERDYNRGLEVQLHEAKQERNEARRQLTAERTKNKQADFELDQLDRERSQLRQQLAALAKVKTL
jgi:septal ring factor EnvC (AmiA/AmiB activator)